MCMWFIKALLNSSYFILNILYWNRNKPRVGKILKNLRYGDRRHQKLDIILPPAPDKPPVLVYVHGGSFISNDKRNFTRICCEYAAAGFAVFNINYGLAPKYQYPSQLGDLTAALSWIGDNRDRFGCDADRMILAGDSAGAYLVAQYVAVRRRPDSIRGLVLFYGSYDIARAAVSGFPLMSKVLTAMFGSGKDDPAVMEDVSPTRHIPEDFPPVFLSAGWKDPLYPESVRFAEQLSSCGISGKTLFFSGDEYPKTGHGFLNFYRTKAARLAMEESIRFIKDVAG